MPMRSVGQQAEALASAVLLRCLRRCVAAWRLAAAGWASKALASMARQLVSVLRPLTVQLLHLGPLRQTHRKQLKQLPNRP